MLQREWIRAYFGMRLFMEQPTAEARSIVGDALSKLHEVERTPGVTYGLNRNTGRRYDIDAFTLEMTWRMANRNRALAEDARILEMARADPDIFLRPISRGGKPPRTNMADAPVAK